MNIAGNLKEFTVTTRQSESFWTVELQVDKSHYRCTTNSPIVLAVLQTVLFKRKLPVDIELSEADPKPPIITKIRLDDRGSTCGGGIPERPDGLPVLPLTPTAFADEKPPKWGFVFFLDGCCSEFKGTSLDVFTVIADAWRERKTTVRLDFDDEDHIVGAR